VDGPHLVGRFALEDLDIPQEQQKFDDDKDRSGDERATRALPLNDVPDDQHGGNKEQHCGNHRVDSLEFPDGQVHEVQDEEDNVDDNNDEVQTAGEAETSLAEARLAAIPVGAEQRAHDESANDLEDLDDASVRAQVTGVDVGHCSSVRRIGSWELRENLRANSNLGN